ncbi:hypothetical protein PC129_g14258 [Phytophthora cactorum]|uniref:Uncharacterized protein n=1 Tax=Phytophthora cactorum TaxID=29920 RepID=A0A8T1G2F1_9STRA|nr:hypothetical protein PC118_g8979 [Phytophthora cactorum]KAG3214843.1 hypothetical protein PC129_g14258 [Phytophthora cactorum]
MPSQLRLKRITPEERRRVLDAYSSGGDWRAIARYDGFPRTTAEYLNLVVEDFNVKLSQTTISRHLIDMMYTIKQVRVEPTTCNNEMNKEKRKEFAEALIRHTDKGDLVVYFDETNYNLYTKRTRGRAKKGKRNREAAAFERRQPADSVRSVVGVREGLHKVIKESDVYKDRQDDCRCARQRTHPLPNRMLWLS